MQVLDRSPMAAQMPMQHRVFHPQPTLYDQLLPVVRLLLEALLDNESEESTQAVTYYIIQHRYSDGHSISDFMVSVPEDVLRGTILEATAHWIRGKIRELDRYIPLVQAGHDSIRERVQAFRRQLEQASYQSSPNEVLAEFIYSVAVEIMGRDAACLASALGGLLVQDRMEVVADVESPAKLLAHMVRKLEEIQAKIAKIVMLIYRDTGHLSWDEAKNLLMVFFQYYTVETHTGDLEMHDNARERDFLASTFKVNLVDSFGCLMKLLCHLEQACMLNTHRHALAVDFEGVRLNRTGPLCLVQITCSDDPTLVYILDVHVLKGRAFTLETPGGTSMKSLLMDRNVRKVWFDPRNDADALYHQFQILPEGIFDLQLAEVADRRSRGLNVSFVAGLQKCLSQCPNLGDNERHFATKISRIGKSLYEPQNGGSYEVFMNRPLNPLILVYAAHDSRYMLLLYEQYTKALQASGDQWISRVLEAGDERGRWCLNDEYVLPDSQAPTF